MDVDGWFQRNEVITMSTMDRGRKAICDNMGRGNVVEHAGRTERVDHVEEKFDFAHSSRDLSYKRNALKNGFMRPPQAIPG